MRKKMYWVVLGTLMFSLLLASNSGFIAAFFHGWG